jgi:hypothetical protein
MLSSVTRCYACTLLIAIHYVSIKLVVLVVCNYTGIAVDRESFTVNHIPIMHVDVYNVM